MNFEIIYKLELDVISALFYIPSPSKLLLIMHPTHFYSWNFHYIYIMVVQNLVVMVLANWNFLSGVHEFWDIKHSEIEQLKISPEPNVDNGL